MRPPRAAASIDTLDLLRQMEETGTLTPTSLSLAQSSDVTIDKCEGVARYLGHLVDASQWWIGDLLLEAEARFGQDAFQIAAATGRSERTLLNWTWCASRVPRALRRETLTFTHHRIVSALPIPEQRVWLERAEDGGWSSRDLQAALEDAASHRAVKKDCSIVYQRGVERLRALVRDCFGPGADVDVRLLRVDHVQIDLDHYRDVLGAS
jgi:hypothetical protein